MDSSVILVTDNNCDEVIDLTDSFTLVDHCNLADVLIEVDSEGSYNTCVTSSNSTENTSKKNPINRKKASVRTKNRPSHCSPEKQENSRESKSGTLGDCPICWDELGKNRLASTKCGHVFCLKCLKKSLRAQKSCPTCRSALRGSSSYHPLYLN